MRYFTNEKVQLGDKLSLEADMQGVVVGIVEDDLYDPSCNAATWSDLDHGLVVDINVAGQIHYGETLQEWSLISRA